MTTPYTEEDASRDRHAIDLALAPVVDPWLARLGLTLEEAVAMARAGIPCPPIPPLPDDDVAPK